jgi:hypothetical protein
VSRLGFEASDEGLNVIWIDDDKKHMNVGSFNDDVADSNWMKSFGTSEAALYDRLTKRVSEEQKPLFETERAE